MLISKFSLESAHCLLCAAFYVGHANRWQPKVAILLERREFKVDVEQRKKWQQRPEGINVVFVSTLIPKQSAAGRRQPTACFIYLRVHLKVTVAH